jgi:glycosidase
MPIYPISEVRRKGSLGSYYAIQDYNAVNPNFGTKADFRELVEAAHDLDMRILLDFVPNHTGWDHPWLTDHPEYYTQDAAGNPIDPINPETGQSWGWTDVADLNYENQDLGAAMVDQLLYWIDSFAIDGYRMDVAGEVPTAFWTFAAERLRRANPELFLLAEAEKPQLRNKELFSADYGWKFHHLLNDLAQGEASPRDLIRWHKEDRIAYHRGFHMQFITNHDENSWNGTVYERMGDNVDPCAVLAFTFDGMPLIYGGQEAGLNKRLDFFEKDPINWSDTSRYEFYRVLLRTKRNNPALWNGSEGGELRILPAPHPRKTFAYARVKGDRRVLVFLNLDRVPQVFNLEAEELAGSYRNIFTGEMTGLASGSTIEVPPHGYRVYSF